ncbi:uncharacterized protein LOC143275757 [Babylonia areolata]|uniref:uncharacterized protein LOC143275757 n=1 Tax=Babylonia areolata TaxID=304850 RepID=UPI003FD52576
MSRDFLSLPQYKTDGLGLPGRSQCWPHEAVSIIPSSGHILVNGLDSPPANPGEDNLKDMTTVSNPTTLNTSAPHPPNTSVTSSECLVLQFQDFVPWNNPDNLISFETEDLVRRLKDVVFLPILYGIGVPANVINMAVFYRQGLKERINVCLFALSLADALYLLCNVMMYGEQLYLQFTTRDMYGSVMQWMISHYFIGFYGFTWVSQVLSAIIASERCFCILHPLRSRTVLRTSTTTCIIVAVFIVVIGGYFIVATRYKLVCVYDPISEATTIQITGSEFYYRHQKLVDFMDVFVYGVGLPGVVMVVVTSTTILTSVKLRQAAKWRAGISSRGAGGGGGGSKEDGMSLREIALTRMLVYNSVFFIVCVIPIVLFRFVLLFVPEMNAGRRLHNLFMMSHWVLVTFSSINASFNFLIYYVMGSQYRHTVTQLLCCCCWRRRRRTPSTSGGGRGGGRRREG